MGFQASLFMDLLSAFIFVSRVHLSFLSLSSGVGETADQLHTLAPSALPLLILLTQQKKKGSRDFLGPHLLPSLFLTRSHSTAQNGDDL